jgi:hypothetical protein
MTDEVQNRLYVIGGPMIRILRDKVLTWEQMLKGFIDNSFDARADSVAIGRADDPSA